MNKRTNLHLNFINVFGEEVLVKIIEDYRNVDAPSHILPLSNPIARFLEGTTYEKYGKLYAKIKLQVPNNDFMYFKLSSILIKKLGAELNENPAYKQQIIGKLLHRQYGPMLSALNELLAAAYYKHLGLEVKLNSSLEKGAADIDLVGTEYATDAKLFPNEQIRLEAMVNESASQLIHFVRKIEHSNLILFVRKPDKRLFHQSLIELDKAFDDPKNFKSFDSEALYAMPMRDNYQAADYTIHIENQNVNIYIQPNWAMDDSIEQMKLSIDKAEKQATALGKKSIPWVMVPGDANKSGIQMQAMRYVAGFHPYIESKENIYIMPVYSLEFKDGKINYVFDVYQTGSNMYGINFESFKSFIEEFNNTDVRVLG